MGHWTGPKAVNITTIPLKHKPDNLPIAKGHENDPIYVKSGRVHDGMKRVNKARLEHKTHLKAYIWTE